MTHRFRTAFMGSSGFVNSGPVAGRPNEDLRVAKTKTTARKLPRVSAFRMPRDAKKTAAA